MKIAFYTLGCKVNQYETQALEQLVTQRGHSLVPFEEAADAYVINTCTVTAVSDKKSRQVIRRARKAAPDAVIAVCGCYPQTHPDDVEKLGVDLIAGTGDRTGFVDLLELYENRDENFGNARDVRNRFEQAVARQSNRVAQLESPTREQLMELLPEDLTEPDAPKED